VESFSEFLGKYEGHYITGRHCWMFC